MRIHIGYADKRQPDQRSELNTSIWRCFIPCTGLVADGQDVTIGHITGVGQVDADAYLLERNLIEDGVPEMIAALKSAGKRLIATFDDAYHIMPEPHRSMTIWTDENVIKFRRLLGLMDAVLVPNRVLADDYANDANMIYVPNYADPSFYYVARRPSGTIRFLWGGNTTHINGITHSGMLPALEKLSRKLRFRLTLVADNVCLSEFLKFVPASMIDVHTWQPFSEWPGFVANNADVILCPLYGEYDRRRSWVKCIDGVMLGLPVVATNMEPYQGTGAYLVKNTAKAWYDILGDMARSSFSRYLRVSDMKRALGDVSIHAHIKEYKEALGCTPFTA